MLSSERFQSARELLEQLPVIHCGAGFSGGQEEPFGCLILVDDDSRRKDNVNYVSSVIREVFG